MIRRVVSRYADAALQRRVADLEVQLDATRRKLAVAEAERDNLAAVVIRERARIEAETAIQRRRQAEAEGMGDERTEERIRRFTA